MHKKNLIEKFNKYSKKINLIGGVVNKDKYKMYINITKNTNNNLQYDLVSDQTLQYTVTSKISTIINPSTNPSTNITNCEISVFNKTIKLFFIDTPLTSDKVKDIIKDTSDYRIICVNSKDKYDITDISPNFIEDFDFDIKTDSKNNKIIFSFTYIDTKLKEIEGVLNLLFNQILMATVLKKEVITDKIYFLSDNIRNYLDYSNKKFKFDCTHIYIDNSIQENIISTLSLIPQLLLRDIFFFPIKNLYNIIKTNKNAIIAKCFQIECDEIQNSDFDKFDFKNTDPSDRIDFLTKYLIITPSTSDTFEIKLFGFRVLYIEFKSSTDIALNECNFIKFEFGSIYESTTIYYQNIKNNKKYSTYYKNISNYNKKYMNKSSTASCSNTTYFDDYDTAYTFMGVYDISCCADAAQIDIENCSKYLDSNKDILNFKMQLMPSTPDYIFDKDALQLNTINNLNIFYIYTAWYSNITDSLISNKVDDKYTIFAENRKYITDKTVREVSEVFTKVFSNSPPTTTEFHVYRATNILKLLKNDRFDFFAADKKIIKNRYYLSTTILEEAHFFENYTDIIYPIILKITIPVGSKVLFLGGAYGQPGQSEVLLNKDTQFEYISSEWKSIRQPDTSINKYLYTLTINLKYKEHQ